MNAETARPTKVFTIQSANRALPLVRAIVSDIVTLSRDVHERRMRLAHLTAGRDLEQGDPYEDELAHIKVDLEKDADRLRDYLRELQQLGVEFKGTDGIVDFPAMLEGRLVFLCWKLGEPEVLHWHEIDGDFSRRQPLTAGAAAPFADDSLGLSS